MMRIKLKKGTKVQIGHDPKNTGKLAREYVLQISDGKYEWKYLNPYRHEGQPSSEYVSVDHLELLGKFNLKQYIDTKEIVLDVPIGTVTIPKKQLLTDSPAISGKNSITEGNTPL